MTNGERPSGAEQAIASAVTIRCVFHSRPAAAYGASRAGSVRQPTQSVTFTLARIPTKSSRTGAKPVVDPHREMLLDPFGAKSGRKFKFSTPLCSMQVEGKRSASYAAALTPASLQASSARKRAVPLSARRIPQISGVAMPGMSSSRGCAPIGDRAPGGFGHAGAP